MKPKSLIFAGALAGLLVLFAYNLKKTYANQQLQSEKAVSEETVTGENLFLNNCASCHQKDRSGNPPLFPSLKEVKSKLTKNEINTLLVTGKGIMPSFAYLQDDERNAIVEFLYGKEVVVDKKTTVTPEQSGRSLFVANCLQCHKVEVNDTEPVNSRNAGMKPAVLGGIDKKMDFDKFSNILNSGPCYMPSFSHLTSQQKIDIFKYLASFEAVLPSATYGGCRGGGGCCR